MKTFTFPTVEANAFNIDNESLFFRLGISICPLGMGLGFTSPGTCSCRFSDLTALAEEV